jgi:hypothetical protein
MNNRRPGPILFSDFRPVYSRSEEVLFSAEVPASPIYSQSVNVGNTA